MQMRLFVLAMLLFASASLCAQAYKWVDEDGVVHYSDRPRPGAEVIELPRQPAPRPVLPSRRPAAVADEPPEEEADPGYESLSFASPEPGVTLWNIEGVLDVSLNLQPALKPGHQVRIYFDGTPRIVSGTSFQLQEVYRGAHNIQAEILDENGTMLIRSQGNLFYVQQTTIVGRGAGPR